MIKENIREKCIYNIVDEYNDNDRHIFFNYLHNLRFSCLETAGEITDSCANTVMNALKIDIQQVKNCMENTEIEAGSYHINTLLEEDREQSI